MSYFTVLFSIGMPIVSVSRPFLDAEESAYCHKELFHELGAIIGQKELRYAIWHGPMVYESFFVLGCGYFA